MNKETTENEGRLYFSLYSHCDFAVSSMEEASLFPPLESGPLVTMGHVT